MYISFGYRTYTLIKKLRYKKSKSSFKIGFSNGLHIVWGITGKISSSYTEVVLPIALKAKIFSISALVYDIGQGILWNELGIAIYQVTNTSFTTSLRSYGGLALNTPICYIAIGA